MDDQLQITQLQQSLRRQFGELAKLLDCKDGTSITDFYQYLKVQCNEITDLQIIILNLNEYINSQMQSCTPNNERALIILRRTIDEYIN